MERDIMNDPVLTAIDMELSRLRTEFSARKDAKVAYLDAMGYTEDEIEAYQEARGTTGITTTTPEAEQRRPVARQADQKTDGRTREGRVASAMNVDDIVLDKIKWNTDGETINLTTREGRALLAAGFVTDQGEWTDEGEAWWNKKQKAEKAGKGQHQRDEDDERVPRR